MKPLSMTLTDLSKPGMISYQSPIVKHMFLSCRCRHSTTLIPSSIPISRPTTRCPGKKWSFWATVCTRSQQLLMRWETVWPQ